MKKWQKLEPTDMATQLKHLRTLYGVGLEAAIDQKRKETYQGAAISDKTTNDTDKHQKRS